MLLFSEQVVLIGWTVIHVLKVSWGWFFSESNGNVYSPIGISCEFFQVSLVENPQGQQLNFLPNTNCSCFGNSPGSVAVESFFVCPVKHPQVIRLVSLQRGVLKVEQKMMGIQCSTYSEPWILSLKCFRNFANHGLLETWHRRWVFSVYSFVAKFQILVVVRIVYGAILSKPSYHRLVNDCTVNGGCCCGHMSILNFRNRLGCWAAYMSWDIYTFISWDIYTFIYVCMYISYTCNYIRVLSICNIYKSINKN